MGVTASYGSTAPETSVLVVDDHRAFAQALGLALDIQPDITYLGVAVTATEALRRLTEAPATVVIVDLGLPDINGIELIPRIRRICPDGRIVVITGSDDPAVYARAGQVGADKVLRKAEPLATIIEAVRQGDTPRIDTRLTDRELEVLDLLAGGHSVTTIARRLNISINTCRGYVRAILAKLDAHSQLAAVATASRLGVLPVQRSRPP